MLLLLCSILLIGFLSLLATISRYIYNVHFEIHDSGYYPGRIPYFISVDLHVQKYSTERFSPMISPSTLFSHEERSTGTHQKSWKCNQNTWLGGILKIRL